HADLLEIAGENAFRINAYRRAADTVKGHDRPIAHETDLTDLPGIGAGIAAVLREIINTGRYSEFEDLQEQLPGSLLTILDVPGLGAKRVARFYRELGITSLPELEDAAREGRLASLKGIGPKAEANILQGIVFLQRRTGRVSIGAALPLAQRLAGHLSAETGNPVWIAGSVRRMCETVGNIDLVAVGENPGTTLNVVSTLLEVAHEVERDDDTATFELQQGIGLRVRVSPVDTAGSALIAMTGSAGHIARLGGMEALPSADTEEACYAALGLDWIPPELREDLGEVDAAREGRLPHLIEVDDLRGDLHLHTSWSDGAATPLEMAEAAARRGYEYLAITDHSGGLGIANGLKPDRLAAQRDEIQALVDAPVRLLAGSEVEVHRDGRLDFEDDLLGSLDLVVASLHSGLRQDVETITARICQTLRNEHVDIVAHPTGRLIERRQGAEYDWPLVFEAARETATAIEINSDPARMDMRDTHARTAAEAGVLITIDSDAHHPDSLSLVRYGVGIARRAWIGPDQVVNTWPLDDLLAWLSERRIPQRG
ncbi:MAG TPA: DNA polymerase/3'-5' exonuclease PolX, partial [Thermomicrobiales bacterium]|nr:DNA polymerase/3'-5' exonuclease PolX [Thermomicrobiales bacterium]